MKINKLISAITAGLSLLTITASSVFAVGANNGGEALTDGTFGYELINGSYTIISCNQDAIVEEIPELRNGYAITAIADKALSNCPNIKTLHIPDTVTSIGDSAFAGCTGLTEITLPKKIKTISEGLLMGCTKLEKVEIPDAVDTIESYAFYNCSFLKEVVLPGQLATIEPMAFSECSSIENIDASKCASYVFEDGLLMIKSKTNMSVPPQSLQGICVFPTA
ncbi:MAG: leucine-rich repeat domain-containing protein [Ruminococcus sp.]|nr:leucine-rich repeat domain-containing protein [Ruminococcus sp.]